LKKLLIKAVLASAVATLSAAIGMLGITLDFETIPAGAAVALFILPAVVLYLLLEHWRPGNWYKHAGFVLGELLAVGVGLYAWWYDETHKGWSDGGGEMALLIGISIAFGAILTHVFLILFDRRH